MFKAYGGHLWGDEGGPELGRGDADAIMDCMDCIPVNCAFENC